MNLNYLRQKLGPIISEGLNDPSIFEIAVNPDGAIWFLTSLGFECAGKMQTNDAAHFVHTFAQAQGQYLNEQKPYLDGKLPFSGERLNVTIAPLCDGVSFNIRKPPTRLFTLDDYVHQKIMTEKQATILRQSIKNKKNILVSGSPASGKTTLTNALLHAMKKLVPLGERLLILEQVPELICSVDNHKILTVSDHISMNQLLWLAMRNSPDRIIVGEVRDGAALDLLKAWNTGCSGGVATLHANNARAAIQRVLDLSCEVTTQPPFALAGEALDVIVQIDPSAQHPAKRHITEMIEVNGFDRATQQFLIETIG